MKKSIITILILFLLFPTSTSALSLPILYEYTKPISVPLIEDIPAEPVNPPPVAPTNPTPSKSDWEIKANKMISFGEKFLGVDYKLGADYDRDGSYLFDCSSFTQYVVYYSLGIKIPRTARPQSTVGIPVERKDLRKGDLVFFTTQNNASKYSKDDIRYIGHVGIYVGWVDGKELILHTYSAKTDGVMYSRMDRGFWDLAYVKAVRLIK